MTDPTPPASGSAATDETAATEQTPLAPARAEVEASEDDRRAAAAAVNRKRALEEWETNKKRWRDMGVPVGLPAKK